jgi:hypothetical protein
MFWYGKYVALSVRQRVTEYIWVNPNRVIFRPFFFVSFCFVFLKLDRWPKGRILLTADLNHECDVDDDQHLETKCYI